MAFRQAFLCSILASCQGGKHKITKWSVNSAVGASGDFKVGRLGAKANASYESTTVEDVEPSPPSSPWSPAPPTSSPTTDKFSPPTVFPGHVTCPSNRPWRKQADFMSSQWAAVSREHLEVLLCSMTRKAGFVLFGVYSEVLYLNTKLENLSTVIGNMGTKLDNVSTVVDNTGKTLEDLSTVVDNLRTKLDNVSTVVNNTGKNLENLSTVVDNISEKLDNLSTVVDNTATKLDNLSTKVDNLSAKLDNHQKVVELQLYFIILLCFITIFCVFKPKLTAGRLPNVLLPRTPPRGSGEQRCGASTWGHLVKMGRAERARAERTRRQSPILQPDFD